MSVNDMLYNYKYTCKSIMVGRKTNNFFFKFGAEALYFIFRYFFLILVLHTVLHAVTAHSTSIHFGGSAILYRCMVPWAHIILCITARAFESIRWLDSNARWSDTAVTHSIAGSYKQVTDAFATAATEPPLSHLVIKISGSGAEFTNNLMQT